MIWHAEVLQPGTARADVLRLDAPISFWGGVRPSTGQITLAGHPQRGLCVSGKLLAIPRLIGSSSSSAVLLELIHKRCAPAALILGHRDAILPIGVIVAGQMDWPTIPVLCLPEMPFRTGETLAIAADGTITKE